MNPTSRLRPVGMATFLCALIAGVGLFALSASLAAPSSSASLYSAQTGEGLPQATPTVPAGCVLDWTIVDGTNAGMASGKFYAVSALSANDVWAVGNYSQNSAPTRTLTLVEHWNGSEWAIVPSPNPGAQSNTLYGVHALAPDDVWAVGTYTVSPQQQWYSLFMHWDGSMWSIISGPASLCRCSLDDVEAVSADDVWAVGNYRTDSGGIRPLIVHWDGVKSTIVPSPFEGSANLRAIDAISRDDVWAVGSYDGANPSISQPLIMHWDGTEWEVVPGPTWANGNSALLDVAAVSSSDIWAVGYTSSSQLEGAEGLTLHWNGVDWEVVPNPTPVSTPADYLIGVSALSANDVWAVGGSDGNSSPPESYLLLLHWDGTSWSIEQPALPASSYSVFYAVAGVSADDVWSVGYAYDAGGPSKTVAEHYTYTCSTPSPTETSTPAPATSTAIPTSSSTSSSTPLSTATSSSTSVSTPPSTATPSPTSLSTSTIIPTHTSTPTQSSTSTHTAISSSSSTPTHTAVPTNTASAIATSTLTPIPCSMQFIDVHPGDYFYNPVRYLYCEGFISGYADNSFRPWNNTTRAQLAKIVVSAKGWSLLNPQSPTFTDVPAGSTFYHFIETAAAQGIIGGYPCGNPEPCDTQNRPYFRPNAEVTRGQLTKIIVAAQGWTILNPQNARFVDVMKGSTFYSYIETAVSHGIITGYPCGNPEPCDPPARPYFRPGNPATRGQIAKIVYNAITSP